MSAEASVIVLAWGEEATLVRCVDSILASRGVAVEAVVVDNGAAPDVMDEVRARDVHVLGPPTNRGFTGGCNAGVAASTGDVVVLVNSDAFVEPDAIATLVERARCPEVGIASASLRLADAPDLMNSAGNPVHYSGVTWAGAFGEPAADHVVERDVASATGAAMALRRDTWERLGGFDEAMFAYLEDTDLSIRCWQSGLAVRYVPGAVVRHEYEFGKHATKFYLLERNRLLLLACDYELRTLAALLPGLLLVELAMTVQALAGGWLRQKLRGWWWLLTHLGHVRERRRFVGATRRVHDGSWMAHASSRIVPANVDQPPGLGVLNALLNAWWHVARRWLRTGATTPAARP
jgi:GT2 family glycosyltransferase